MSRDGRVDEKNCKSAMTSKEDEDTIKHHSTTTSSLTVIVKLMESLEKAERNLENLPTFANEESLQTFKGLISFLQNEVGKCTPDISH